MPLSENDCAATYKVLIAGDAYVGKTALLRCLMGYEFSPQLRPTVAVDFVTKPFEVDGALIQMMIWDSAGQKRFMSMTRQQYKEVKGIAVVFDISDRSTFTHLSFWLESINNCVSNFVCNYESVPIILIGNKADLKERRMVSISEAKKFANKEMAFDYFETSAKTGTNVFAAFQKLAYHVTEICNPQVMKSYHPHMLRPPEVLAVKKSALPYKVENVTRIPEKFKPVGQLRTSMRGGKYKFRVRKRKKKYAQCCSVQ
ncbi:uncharacterized protein LOC133202850 [Saccostrea echinata]|uniref:uncharacterized protein LOC133202850 n=1 Tax=Saccostrea echinata TaxID=191078 RepID=UPI002A8327E1|nr:uncharacterized protein LOC133202850 [Saccostrea echinata]